VLGLKLLTEGLATFSVRQGEVEAVAAWCGAGWSVVAVQLADGVLGGVGSSSAKRKQDW
jgi:hypothetical protein